MKRIRIVHNTEYSYHQPVKFGPHRAMMRPREGHDVNIAKRVSASSQERKCAGYATLMTIALPSYVSRNPQKPQDHKRSGC